MEGIFLFLKLFELKLISDEVRVLVSFCFESGLFFKDSIYFFGEVVVGVDLQLGYSAFIEELVNEFPDVVLLKVSKVGILNLFSREDVISDRGLIGTSLL